MRLANEPLLNHWWNSSLYLTARGLTTSLMPHPTGPAFQIDFDFVAHQLHVTTTAGTTRSLPLEPRPVADFYTAVMGMLDELDVTTSVWPVPVEIEGAIAFADDRAHAAYDRLAVQRFWRALIDMQRGLGDFPHTLRRQVQPGSCVLGRPRPRPHQVLGPHRPTPAARRTAAHM